MPDQTGRKSPRKPSAETKWEIFSQVTAGEISQADAARRGLARAREERLAYHRRTDTGSTEETP